MEEALKEEVVVKQKPLPEEERVAAVATTELTLNLHQDTAHCHRLHAQTPSRVAVVDGHSMGTDTSRPLGAADVTTYTQLHPRNVLINTPSPVSEAHHAKLLGQQHAQFVVEQEHKLAELRSQMHQMVREVEAIKMKSPSQEPNETVQSVQPTSSSPSPTLLNTTNELEGVKVEGAVSRSTVSKSTTTTPMQMQQSPAHDAARDYPQNLARALSSVDQVQCAENRVHSDHSYPRHLRDTSTPLQRKKSHAALHTEEQSALELELVEIDRILHAIAKCLPTPNITAHRSSWSLYDLRVACNTIQTIATNSRSNQVTSSMFAHKIVDLVHGLSTLMREMWYAFEREHDLVHCATRRSTAEVCKSQTLISELELKVSVCEHAISTHQTELDNIESVSKQENLAHAAALARERQLRMKQQVAFDQLLSTHQSTLDENATLQRQVDHYSEVLKSVSGDTSHVLQLKQFEDSWLSHEIESMRETSELVRLLDMQNEQQIQALQDLTMQSPKKQI
eukprot:m.94395 g.94395  ORF g.94395 m.94395 type:complete len:508 (-) comp26717_c0_seq1:195-1718(-)